MDLTELDAHEAPADWLRAIWKGFSRMEPKELNESPLVTDPRSPDHLRRLRQAGTINAAQITKAFSYIDIASEEREDAAIYYHPLLPGSSFISLLSTLFFFFICFSFLSFIFFARLFHLAALPGRIVHLPRHR